MRGKYEKQEKKKTWLIIALIICIVICLGVTIWALFFRQIGPTLTPDYAPQQLEQNAKPIEDDDDTKLDAPEGGGSVSLSYATTITIDLSEEKAFLMFANPGKSTQDMVVQVVVQDTVLVQSGRLAPGNEVKTLDLLDDAVKMLSHGGYDGKFVILFYDTQSGEKAIVNTEIPISITVVE